MADAFPLPAELNIYGAAETRNALLAALAAEPADADAAFVVDAAAVAEVDAAGVQVLAALQRSLADRGRALRIEPASDVLGAACRGLGLGQLLELS